MADNFSFGTDNSSNRTNQNDDIFAVPLIYRQIFGSIFFVIVWPFIAFDVQKYYPLSRPAAALVGATFMVMFLVVPVSQTFDVIGEKGNMQTICLLVGMMLMSYYYDREGLLQLIALWIFGKNKPFRHILWKVCVGSAVLSAIITNDATCIVITPLILKEHTRQKRSRKEYAPLLIGIATSANIGSAATFFGNPQNAFIAANAEGEISLLTFFATGLPAAVLGMCLSITILYLVYCRVIFGCRLGGNVDEGQSTAEESPRRIQVPFDDECSISPSRAEYALSLDFSEHPYASSQIALERSLLSHSQISASLPIIQTQDSWSDSNYGAVETTRFSSASQPILNSRPSSSPLRNLQCQSRPMAQSTARNSSIVPVDVASAEVPEEVVTSICSGEGEGEVVVDVASFSKRKWRSKLFLIWLLAITVILVALLAVPGPPTTSVDFNLGLVPLGCAILTMLVDTTLNRKVAYDAMVKIDWPIILMFMGLFVWLTGFENTGFPDKAFKWIREYMDLSTVQGVLLFTVFVAVGSNILSNVPLVIIIIDKIENFRCGSDKCDIRLVGVLLAWVATIAGNFTLIGSIANLIVAEKARKCANYPLTFFGYLKFGFVSTMFVIFAGLPIVYFAGANITI